MCCWLYVYINIVSTPCNYVVTMARHNVIDTKLGLVEVSAKSTWILNKAFTCLTLTKPFLWIYPYALRWQTQEYGKWLLKGITETYPTEQIQTQILVVMVMSGRKVMACAESMNPIVSAKAVLWLVISRGWYPSVILFAYFALFFPCLCRLSPGSWDTLNCSHVWMVYLDTSVCD